MITPPPPPPPPPPSYFVLVTCYLSVFESFPTYFCQNFGMSAISDCFFICLSVCLFVCNVNDTGRTVQAINTKLGTCMYLGSGYGCIVFGVHDVIDDVIRSKNRSNFEIAITPSIFELECRTKSQKIGNGMAYLGVGLNFRYNFRFKRSPWPQNGGHFENFEIF